jgi:hypothetical protein
MRTRRRRLIIVGLMLAPATAALVWCLTRPNPKIDGEHHEQIKHSMTLAEVEQIIGAPPGDYGGRDPSQYGIQACQGWICSLLCDWRYGKPSIPLDEIQGRLDEGRIVVWTGPQYAIAVQLDSQDRVVGTGLGFYGLEPTWWQRLLQRVGIQ